jgi:hypothetical protein
MSAPPSQLAPLQRETLPAYPEDLPEPPGLPIPCPSLLPFPTHCDLS